MTSPDLADPETDLAGDPGPPSTDSTATPGAFAAGAAVYRRLERRQRQPQRLMAVLLALIAVALSLGVITLEKTSRPGAAPAAQAAADEHR
jgi:hypothetical protein